MPPLMAVDTKAALGERAVLCDSRMLLLERFADLAPGRPAGQALEAAIAKATPSCKLESWREFVLTRLPIKPEDILFGQLRSRLTVTTAGGLPEVGGLCLDRLTGVPCIPGSAIRGCARGYALQLLAETVELAAKVELLAQIGLVFGWRDGDWQTNEDDSSRPRPTARREGLDFAWACQELWPEASLLARQRLWKLWPQTSHQTSGDSTWSSRRPRPGAPGGARAPFSLGNWRREMAGFRGEVRFLPAYPWEPLKAELELEVRTNHHPAYYRAKTDHKSPRDVEEPDAAFFPVVAPDHVFAFVMLGQAGYRKLAWRWLQGALATGGLGGRRTAGYGWFDTSDALQKIWQAKAAEIQAREQKRMQQEQEEQVRQAQAESQRRAEAERRQKFQDMSEEEQEDYKIAQLTDEQFRGKLQNFERHLTKDEQFAAVRALRGPRAPLWGELKQRASKGGQWAQVEQAIRTASKKSGQGKMP